MPSSSKAYACRVCHAVDILDDVVMVDVAPEEYVCVYCRMVNDFDDLLRTVGEGEQRMLPWQLICLSRWMRAREAA